MTVQEYRDLIDGLRDGLASTTSAANDDEAESECRRLAEWHNDLHTAKCQRATPKDRARAAKWLELARQKINATMMRLYDNERINEEHRCGL